MARRTAVRDGVEYFVEEGVGHVEKVDMPRPGRQNAHVEIRDPGLGHPIKGWANTHDAILTGCLTEAHETGRRIRYRVEVVRNDSIPATVPMADVPDKQRFRRLVEIVPAGAGAGPGADPPERPQEAQDGSQAPDPRPPARSPADAPEAARSAQSDGTPPADDARPRRGPRLEEAKPWEPTNSDGSLNLGSYAYGAVVATVELAHELIVAHLLLSPPGLDARLDPDPVPNMGQVARLAKTLLGAADEIQAGIRPDGHVDRMDASHTRARGAMRSALEAYPVPFGAERDVQAEWRANVIARGRDLMGVALSILAAEEAGS